MVRRGRRRRRECSCDSAGASACWRSSVGASGASSDSPTAMLAADALTVAVVFVVLAQLPIAGTRRGSSSSCTVSFRARRRRCCAASRRSSSASPPPARIPRRAWGARRDASGSRSSSASCCRAGPSCGPRRSSRAACSSAAWSWRCSSRSWRSGAAMAGALQSHDPRRLDQERTLLVGVDQQIRTFLAEHVDPALDPPAVYELEPEWPGDQQEGWHKLYEEVHRSRADAIILVGPLTDEALQNVLIAGSSRGLPRVRAATPAAARDEQPHADPARRGTDLAAEQPRAARLAARREAHCST